MADKGVEKEGIGWRELLVDKSFDAILIPVGLFAALWFQGWVDERKEREDYVVIVEDFRREVTGNRERVALLEKDIGPLAEMEPEKVLGPMQEQLDRMKADSESLSSFFDCADAMLEIAARAPGILGQEPAPGEVAAPDAEVAAGPEALNEEELALMKDCATVFEAIDKRQPNRFVGVDLSPFYGYVVWTVYLQNGIKLFKDAEAKRLGLLLGEVYASQREVEQRLDDIENLFNDVLMKSSGKLAALLAEADDLVPDAPSLDELREVQARLGAMGQEAFDLRYAIENTRNVLSLKVTRLKDFLGTLNARLDGVVAALQAEQARIGTPK